MSLGILERMHKLHYLLTVEASDEIVFPRVKRRLLQLKEESADTFQVPTIKELETSILSAKLEAITKARECGILLEQYGDEFLLFPTNEALIQSAVDNDNENEENETIVISSAECGLSKIEAIMINEDIRNINLTKQKSSGIPKYIESEKSSTSRSYSMYNSTKTSAFIEYNGAYIRKSTALYLLQENKQISNDRLLRVRASQPDHLFDGESGIELDQDYIVRSGDLCFFRRADSEKNLIGRLIQFSYLEGTKKQRQYSSSYVDLSLDSWKTIGVFANWYKAIQPLERNTKVLFNPAEGFTTGYLPMENYVSKINETHLEDDDNASFSISKNYLEDIHPNWKNLLTFNAVFDI